MASHSAYFRALLNNSQFCEISMSTRGKLTFITLNNIGAHLFSLIIGFIYLNTTEASLLSQNLGAHVDILPF